MRSTYSLSERREHRIERETNNKTDVKGTEHLRVIAHEGEVVVGLRERELWVDKNASEARGMAGGKLV